MPFRNREAAFSLATFIARFWSAPGRIIEGFVIDRRELADREDLGLSEAKVRGAIRVLEEIGFLDRAVSSGSKYKATEDGLRRKPIRFEFGSEYAPAFIKANGRAAAARGGRSGERRAITPTSAPRPSRAFPEAQKTNSPKCKSEAVPMVNLGELSKGSGLPPKAFEPNPALESALDKLLQGIRQSRGSGNGSAK
jgi:biotin operon repressor